MKLSARVIPFGLIALHAIFILLFIDPKVHPGGDDSDYIIASIDFLNGEKFPSWHGSFYPIFLSPFISLFGIYVIKLKFISVALSLLSFWFLREAIKKHVSQKAQYFVLTIMACNYSLAVYASTTYSEPLYMFMQSIVLYIFSKLYFETDNKSGNSKLILWAGLGTATFLLSITRHVGIGCWIAFVVFFAIEGRWKSAAVVIALFTFFNWVFAFYKKLVWGITQSGIEGQLSKMADKNFYNPNEGKLGLTEFIERFWQNSNIYLSKHLTNFMGFRSSNSIEPWPTVTVLFYLIFMFTIWVSFKRNKFVLFLTIYIVTVLSITFISQQIEWDQERLVLVYLPIILLIIAFVINDLLPTKYANYTTLPILILIPLMVLGRTFSMEKNIWTSIMNLKGRKYYGYPEDLQNYSEISEWVGEKIPKEKTVLCRKPGISCIYGKRKFIGISSYYHLVPDSSDNWLNRRKIDYVILDNLSMPSVHRLLFFYLQKYPLGLAYIYEIGKNNISYLLEIKRDSPTSEDDFFKRVSSGILIYPDVPYYYVLAANRYFETGNDAKAVEYYSAALKQKSSNEEKSSIRYQRTSSFLRMKDFEKAKEEAKALAAEFPNDKKFRDLLALVHFNESSEHNRKAK